MKLKIATAFAAASFATTAFAGGHATGDAEAGAKAFNQCKSCHMVVDDAGETIVRGGRTGPNLWGVVGRTAGTEDFRYSDIMVTAGEGGLVWDEASFVAYAQDPTPYLQEVTGEKGRGKMTFKARKEADVINIWAYLASVSPEPATN